MKKIFQSDSSLVFKGFPTLEKARSAWYDAHDTGVIAAIHNGVGRQFWSVTEGVRPGVYTSV